MGTVSVSVPDGLRKRMNTLEHINWSAIARKAFEQQLELEEFKTIVAKSKLSEADAREIGDQVNRAAAKRFREL